MNTNEMNIKELTARLNAICEAAHERMDIAVSNAHFLAGAVCEYDYMTDDERSEVYIIKLELAARNVDTKEQARQRILERHKARRLERQKARELNN